MNHQTHESLRLTEQVSELLVVRASGHENDNQRDYPNWELPNHELQRLLKVGIGGVILFGGSCTEIQRRCHRLNQWAIKPLLLCADIEEGVGQRFKGGTWLVPPMALAQLYLKEPQRAMALAKKYGECIGMQAKLCGLNWVLGPVCDVNSNPRNPVINVRAWGEDPQTVSKLVSAFQQGLASEGVLSCAKHFPGHGDTEIDSHLDLPLLGQDIQQLELCELIPFEAAIEAGVNSVMTAHVLLKQIDPKYPATLSKKIISSLLRQKLNFQGLVVTDALVMEAITKSYSSGEAAVLAFAAGADLILMPQNPDEAIKAICHALTSKKIPMERLEQALNRRRKALRKLQSFECKVSSKTASINHNGIESEQSSQLAEELVRLSLQIRNPGTLQTQKEAINLIRVDDVLPCQVLSQNAPALQLPTEAGYSTVLCHKLSITPWEKRPDGSLNLNRIGIGPVLIQLFIRGNPFVGNSNSMEPWLETIEQLQNQQRLAGLVVYGNPYLWLELSRCLDPNIPAAYSPGQMQEAQSQVLTNLLEDKIFDKDSQVEPWKQFTD